MARHKDMSGVGVKKETRFENGRIKDGFVVIGRFWTLDKASAEDVANDLQEFLKGYERG